MYIRATDLFKKDVIVVYRNDSDKRFHLAESQSMIAHIDHMFSTQIKFDRFSQLKDDVENEKVVMEILETHQDRFVRQTKLLKYRNDLLDKGYTEYSTTRYADAKVKLKIVSINQKMYAMVYLTLGKKPKTVLGIFDKMDDAKQFMTEHYADGKILTDSIVIADNEYTKKFSSMSLT